MAQPAKDIIVERGPAQSGVEVTVSTSRDGVKSKKVIKVNGLSTHDEEVYVESLELAVLALSAKLDSMSKDWLASLVSMLIPSKPARPTILREAKMLARAKARILNSGDWLTAQDVAELAQLSTINASSQPNKWKRAGKIFALRHEGTDYFPVYGLDQQTSYRPRASLAPVITELAQSKDGWGMAFWFGSSNSYLAGRMPKDVLAEDPELVLKAAKDEVHGAQHG